MNTPELVEWQRVSSETGLIECWWTHPCLDVINTWDLKDKTWLEFGAGLGTASLRQKCKWVDSIEANTEWAIKADLYARANNLENGDVIRFPFGDIPDGLVHYLPMYMSLIPNKEYDIISVDGIYRNECLVWALNHFKRKGGILVVDNLDQDYVWISPAANELMAPYPCQIYYQPGHINHEGKSWNTRIYEISAT